MKKEFFVLLLSCLLGSSAFAQELKESQVPAAAKAAFAKARPNVKGAWEKEGSNYEVVYKIGSKTMSSVVTKTGSILETETDLSADELPQNLKTYVAQHYKGAKIKGGAKIVKDNNEVNYEVNLNGRELLFDSNGKMIQKEKE